MSEDKVKILGTAVRQGDRPEIEVPRMRSQQEIYDELFRIGDPHRYESRVVREVLRQRVIALNWVLNLTLSYSDSDHVKNLMLTQKEVELLETLIQ